MRYVGRKSKGRRGRLFFPFFFFSTSSAFLDSEIPFYSLLQEEK